MTTKLHAAKTVASVTEAIGAVRGTFPKTRGIATGADGSHREGRTVTAIKAGMSRDVVGLGQGTARTERDRAADQEATKNLDTRRRRAGTFAESMMAMNRIGESAGGTRAGTGTGTGAETDTGHGEVSLPVLM